MDAVTQVTTAVERLDAEHDALVEACTDPYATDLAELYAAVQDARIVLQRVERAVELATAKAMAGDYAETATLRVERYRATDRKAWDHDAWKRDVRAKAVQVAGLKGCHLVLPTGELLDGTDASAVLYGLLERLQDAHGSAAPKVTALRGLGLDARDYCETSPGAWHVKVLRMADESEGAA